MTLSELAGRVASKVDLSQANAQDLLQQVFSEIVEALITDGRVELRRFGIFQLKKRRAYMSTVNEVASAPSPDLTSSRFQIYAAA
jgi:nucleoid DNA-binding protein